MERIRLRPLVLAAALSAVALVPMAAPALARDAHHELESHPSLTYRQVMPALLPNSKENTSVIVQNNGTANATIVMDVYTPAGVAIPSASVPYTNVPPGGTRVFAQAVNSGLVQGFRGVGVLSSDQPINALLVRDIEQQGTGKKSYSIHNAYASGGSKVTLPFIANNLAGTFQTRFAVANTGSATSCVTVTYSFPPPSTRTPVTDSGPGGGGCTSGYPVPVNGQISFAPNNVDGATPMPSSTAGELMAATVTATGAPVTVAVDAYLSSGLRKLASYDGFVVDADANSTTDDVGKNIIIPIAIKTAGFYSQILVSNPNAAAATAKITYKDGTSGATYTVTLSVPANGTASHSVYESAGNIPEGFVGSATIEADQPLAAVVFRSKMTGPGSQVDEDLYTAANGVPTDRATKVAKFPLIFRRAYKSGGADGYNTWVSVAAADGGAASLTITAINDTSNTAPNCSASATYTATKTINGSFVFYQNADSDNGFGANPSCFWGGMTITSDKPIIAIADATNDLNLGDNDGLYNAFGS